MENSSSSSAETMRKPYLTRLAVCSAWVVGIGLAFGWAESFLAGQDRPTAMRLGALLLPWLVYGLFVRSYRRMWRPDELEALITRQALSFAFYGMGFGAVAISQLQAAGFLVGFAWTTERLLLGMLGLLVVGQGWSKFRYR
jgi:hypothetical protein